MRQQNSYYSTYMLNILSALSKDMLKPNVQLVMTQIFIALIKKQKAL